MKENKEILEVQLFSSPNEYEINEVCAILTENSIPFIKKQDGSGSYMNLYMGQSIQEKRIFVSIEDYNRALELISFLISDDIDTENEILEEDLKNHNSNTKYTLIRRGLGFLILGMPILAIILVIIISLIYN